MYMKAQFFNDRKKAKEILLFGHDPRTAKNLGREVSNYVEEEWSKVRTEMMYNACLLKFQSSKELAQKLIDTGDRILVEGTPFDPIWGVMIKWDNDLILDKKNWKGLNLLGIVLMRVRNDIKKLK